VQHYLLRQLLTTDLLHSNPTLSGITERTKSRWFGVRSGSTIAGSGVFGVCLHFLSKLSNVNLKEARVCESVIVEVASWHVLLLLFVLE
jgi:hypothetical protein